MPLLERDAELASLDDVLDRAVDGAGRLAVIEGLAGIGKSRLLAELTTNAADNGARVLSARGSELERDFSFGVARQLFEPLLASDRERLLAGSAESAAAVFESVAAAEDVRDASFASLHGLYWLTVNASADGPLVLAVDDLHWCDPPSLRYLAYLARRLEGMPVLVATTLRSTDPGTDPALLGELTHDPLTVAVRPQPLSAPGVAALVRERLGEGAGEGFCAACHASTSGNPLLLGQLLSSLAAAGVEPSDQNVRAVHDIGPRAISRSVLLRLARLPADAVEVVRAVAICGDGADLVLVARLAGLDEARVAAATGPLARAEILRPEMPLAFVHPLVLDAVLDDVPPGERALRHATAARLLADAGAAPEAVASHLVLTPRRGDPWVVDVLEAAAAAARHQGAPDSAAAYLRRALEEPPADDRAVRIRYELGLLEAMSNGPDAAVNLGAVLDQLDDPHERATGAAWLARTQVFAGDVEGGAELAARVAAELKHEPELADERNALLAVEVLGVVFGVRDRESVARLDPWNVGSDGPGARSLEGALAYHMAHIDGTADECARLALRSVADTDAPAYVDTGLFAIAATCALTLADREETLAAVDTQLGLARRHGSLFAVGGGHLWRGFALWWRGELEDAEEVLVRSFHEMRLWGARNATTPALMALVRMDRGDLAGAHLALEDPGEVRRPRSVGAGWHRRARAELALVEGRNADAIAFADETEKHLDADVNPAYASWRSLKAIALDRLGRTDEALVLAAEELELARHWGAPATVGRCLRILGTLERADGIARLEEAVAVLAQSTAVLEHARALFALGVAVRRDRKPTDAREPLRRALEIAEARGAEPLVEAARSELYATGARPRSGALSGVESLTPSERRVAGLAAEGRSNRDIAQELFVTPKTVEVHLSNCYRKLGISSRRDLAVALV